MAPEIGQELKRARESRGLELREVERVIKIRPKYLLAMEEDRWADLPGEAYARGFLSTYARYLDLDEMALVDRYKAGPGREASEGASPVPEEMLPRRGEVRKHPVRPRAVAKLLAAVAVIAAVVVVLVSVSDDGEQGAGDVLRGDGRAATTDNTEEATEQEAEPKPEPNPKRPAQTELELVATDSVWVCVVDNRERARVEGETLAAGDERGPFKGTAFAMTFGNGGVELTVDGDGVEVPDAGEPLGFRVNGNGVKELDEAERPDCA